MKTLQSLILDATDLCDEEYDTAQWVSWFNAAIDDMAEVLYITKRVTITANPDGNFPVPDDMKTIVRVDSITPNIKPVMVADDVSLGYRIIGNLIEVQGEDPTTIVMLYYRYPAYLSAADATGSLDISDRYTNGLVLYACAQGMLREDETERYNLFNGQYLTFKEGVFNMSKTKMPSRSGQVPVTR